MVSTTDHIGTEENPNTSAKPNAIKLVELIDTLDEGVERHGL